MTAMDNQSITLSDGRSLGFQCLGESDGCPLFFFHGSPGSRLVLSQEDLLAKIPDVRLILPERPGYGISDPKPERVFLDWPNDVAELADYLGLDSFAVSGGSGGGPYALACAYSLASRVTKAMLFASHAPTDFKGATRGMMFGNKLGVWLGRNAPWALRILSRGQASAFQRSPDKFMNVLAKNVAPPDQALFKDPEFREAVLQDLREGFRQGSEGHATDSVVASQPWGFRLREISVPVFVWHGEEDVLVTTAMAEYLAREIPKCKLRIVPKAAHMLVDNPAVVDEVRRLMYEEVS
jgi:pimeloyl-ACP methyl ester carboxylesterase